MATQRISHREALSQLPQSGNTLSYFPRDLTEKCILVYLIALCVVSVLYSNFVMPWWLWFFGIVSVVLFFYGSNRLTKLWHHISERSFAQRLFLWAFAIRVIYVIFIYYFNWGHYGTYHESSDGDILWYVPSGLQMAQQFSEVGWGEVIRTWLSWGVNIADIGYVVYLAIIYLLTDSVSDVVLPLILKALYGAITCVMMYRISKRHFGEHVGRMTGVFCMLQANLIWWCGSMMKETEMVFLTIWCIHEMDRVLSRGSFKLQNLSGSVVLGLLLFTFRDSLALIVFMSLFLAILLTSSKVVTVATKIIVGVIVVVVVGLSYGDNIIDIVQDTHEKVTSDYQSVNMEWRAQREGGNQFARYAGATVFAPLIFTLPFPSMTYTFQEQEMHMMMNGGYYVKNLLSFFVVMVMFIFLFSGEWRKHTFLLAVLLGYLLALVLSNFAQSGRFHMPIIPLELMFAAYGICMLYKNRTYKRWFNYVLAAEIVVCVAWAWFKLAGRGWI